MTMAYLKNETDFETAVKKYEYVIVDMFAEWCGPCRAVAPILDRLADEFPDVKFIKVDIDRYDMIVSQFNITSIPSVLFFKNGNHIGSLTLQGLHKENSYRNNITKMIS